MRCLLVADSDAFLKAASILLRREGMTVVGVASNSAEALRRARLLDQGGQGGDAEVILISAHTETDYAELAGESPAAGFLPKSELSAQAIGRILGRTP
jgi:hypothetical protein